MAKDIFSESPVWEQFQEAARQRRRNPVRLLTGYMRECLEIWEDQKLDEQIRREAQSGDYHERDAVKIVRQYRHEKREKSAAALGAPSRGARHECSCRLLPQSLD